MDFHINIQKLIAKGWGGFGNRQPAEIRVK